MYRLPENFNNRWFSLKSINGARIISQTSFQTISQKLYPCEGTTSIIIIYIIHISSAPILYKSLHNTASAISISTYLLKIRPKKHNKRILFSKGNPQQYYYYFHQENQCNDIWCFSHTTTHLLHRHQTHTHITILYLNVISHTYFVHIFH